MNDSVERADMVLTAPDGRTHIAKGDKVTGYTFTVLEAGRVVRSEQGLTFEQVQLRLRPLAH